MNKALKRLVGALRYYRATAANLVVLDRRLLYSLWEIEHLRKLLSHLQVDCVFDVGANEGQYASMLRRKVRYEGLIVSFEPDPVVANTLRTRAARDPDWIVEETALADSVGERQFNRMASSQFSSLSTPRPVGLAGFEGATSVRETIWVRTDTLPNVLHRLRVDRRIERPFLKLDTQGYDVGIITAAGQSLREFVGFQSELSIRRLYEDSVDFRTALALYEAKGFCISALVANNAGHFPQLLECDCIMVRQDLVGS